MLQKFQEHLLHNFAFLDKKRILIAVSGGMDSVALTHLLKKLNYNISIAHCNFKLRGKESDLDQEFVEKLATQLEIPVYITQFETEKYCTENKTSIQIGARELRYNWFQQLYIEHHFDYILTAHHLNDVMETFLINLSRGTGIEGLTSIPAVNNNIVRPLLAFSRNDIKKYIENNQYLWREDASNSETKYLRNKIRHRIIPELYSLNNNFENNFKLTIQNLQENEAFVKNKIQALKTKIFRTKNNLHYICKEEIKALNNYEIYNLFKPYGFNSVTEIIKLKNTQSGKEISSDSHCLLNNRNDVILYTKTEENHTEYAIEDIENTTHLPIKISFTKKNKTTENSILVDLEANPFPFYLRKKKDGESFYPKGMNGKKKVSKYFKDLKLSKIEKEQTWLLCNSNNEIIWIVGWRADGTKTTNTENKNTIYINI